MDFTDHLGIADVAKQTGLTQDTLRWYERQGVIPPVPRQGDGRRSYDEASVRIIQLIVRLRRTGMPVEDMRQFCGRGRRAMGVGWLCCVTTAQESKSRLRSYRRICRLWMRRLSTTRTSLNGGLTATSSRSPTQIFVNNRGDCCDYSYYSPGRRPRGQSTGFRRYGA